jgi:hypothetical protein
MGEGYQAAGAAEPLLIASLSMHQGPLPSTWYYGFARVTLLALERLAHPDLFRA